ncbi:MAG: M3 family metallopeptidase [Verrucomicrobiota bacterium]
MRWTILLLPAALVALAGCATVKTNCGNDAANPLRDFQARAAKYHSVITLPEFETTPEQVAATAAKTIADGNAALDRIGQVTPAAATFANTFVALDDFSFQVGRASGRLGLIEQTSTNAAVRDAATEASKKLSAWAVGVDYREDVYRALKSFAAKNPKLTGEDKKLYDQTLRDYRRAGLELPPAQRDEVEKMRKELTALETDFQNNVTKAEKAIKFTKAELAGVPDDFLSQIKTGVDEYTVKANVTWHTLSVMDNCRIEATRKKFLAARDNLARTANLPLLEKILSRRDRIAKKLGYSNYADLTTEVKMTKNAAAAIKFLQDLKAGLQPKFAAELEQFRQLKIAQTGDHNAQINIWDWRYFSNELKKQKYNVDAEQLRIYFPFQRVLDGMFTIYQRIFGLKFERLEPPYKWIGDLQLYSVSDAKTGEPLGLFYLDMFPREGKYNHFAQFGIIDGKRLPDGNYQRPVCALVCNFPPPQPDKPSLLSHDEVETIFHEFGHAMHTILTRATYSRFAGTSVPQDFVEAPSQMLENWPWDKAILDTFAADYRDPSKKIPAEILAQLKAARLATEGTRYRRQLSFALMDLTLHTQINAANAGDTLALSNQKLGEVFLPMLPDTAFIAYFGHIIGYGGGYYGYAWADAIAADMDTVFEKSRAGHLDIATGLKLRKEIYEVGDSRDVNESIEKFLGRPRSIAPFLKRIGVK